MVRYTPIISLIVSTSLGMLEAWKMPNLVPAEIVSGLRRVTCTALTAGSLIITSPLIALSVDDPGSFANQLKLVQAQQVQSQKDAYEVAELDAINRELKWPEGRLIARGAALLLPQGTDPQAFPYGMRDMSALDPAYSTDDATLFILGVGREDLTPIAAKMIPAKDLTFPLIFELETSDLVFPYTPDAWIASTNSKDSIAVTCILSPGKKLSTPVPEVLSLVGFAVSEPVNIAGSFQRSTARVFINGRIDSKLYTKEEIDILTKIDAALAPTPGKDDKNNLKPGKAPAKSKTNKLTSTSASNVRTKLAGTDSA